MKRPPLPNIKIKLTYYLLTPRFYEPRSIESIEVFTNKDEQIKNSATAFARANSKAIARSITDPFAHRDEAEPWSIFMAGAPGAGKTEVAKAFESMANAVNSDADQQSCRILHIDPDAFREALPGYSGANSWLFNSAVSLITESVLDMAFKRGISFILDGTFTSESVAEKNIARALFRGYSATIIYVYQDPLHAWRFVQSRELVEGRNIPLDEFIHKHFAARETVKSLKYLYGNRINIDLIIQCDIIVMQKPLTIQNLPADLIDQLTPEPYSEKHLLSTLTTRVPQ